MDLRIRGKVALVAGASSGIGEAVALALAREGVRLAVSARRQHLLEDVARRALAEGAQQSAAFVAEQNDAAAQAQLVHQVSDQLGPVDILVVNGGGPRPGKVSE